MDAAFWHEKWATGDIGFHEGVPNQFLVRHFGELGLAPGARLLVPLSGKSRDLAWLLSRGYRVAGVELSEVAAREWFSESGLEPAIEETGPLRRLHGPGVDIFVGDIFHLDTHRLGSVDAVYDRAALVALPGPTRTRYARHVRELSRDAPQLLICFEYDQAALEGPPFAVPEDEVRRHYEASHDVRLLERRPVEGGLKGQCEAWEDVWLLCPRAGR